MTRARDLSNLIGSGNYTSTTFTATAGQTVFTIAHTQGFIQVFMNGLLLDETTDYTSNGTAVTLTEAATAGDELEVVKYNTFSVGDAITQTDADTRYVNASGDTMTGDLVVNTKIAVNNTNPLDVLHVSGGSDGQNVFQKNGHLLLQNGTYSTTDWWTVAPRNNGSLDIGLGPLDPDGGRYVGSSDRAIRVTPEGYVEMRKQPSFHTARSNDYSINIAGQHRIVHFNSTQHNEGNHWNGSTGLYTAPVDGVYQFNTTVRINNQNSGSYMLVKMYQNPTFNGDQITGGTTIPGMYSISTTMSSYNTRQLSCTIKLAANDIVCVSAYSHGDTSWGIDNNSHFSGYLVG